MPNSKFLEPRVVVAPKVIIMVSLISLSFILLLRTDKPVISFTAAFIAFSENNTGNSSMVTSLKFSFAKSLTFLFSSSTVNFLPSFLTALVMAVLNPWRLLKTLVLEPAKPENTPSKVAIAFPATAALVKASSSVRPARTKSALMSSTDWAAVLAYEARPMP